MNFATHYPRLWRLFFWFLVANMVWALVEGFMDSSTSIWKMAIGTAFSALFLIPIHGYIWQRAYQPRWLWHVLKWWSVVVFVFMMLAAGYTLSQALSNGVLPIFAAIVAMVAEYFYFFAVDQYLAHSPHLWSEDPTDNLSQSVGEPADQQQ